MVNQKGVWYESYNAKRRPAETKMEVGAVVISRLKIWEMMSESAGPHPGTCIFIVEELSFQVVASSKLSCAHGCVQSI